MTWTLTSLVIQTNAGIIGGHVAAVATREHAFATAGHAVAGLIGEFSSGYFLQTLAVTMVTGTGTLNEPRPAEIFVVQALAVMHNAGIYREQRRVTTRSLQHIPLQGRPTPSTRRGTR